MNEPKCPQCGREKSPSELARKLLVSAEAVLDHEHNSPRAHVYVPARELKTVCEQVLTTPAPEPPAEQKPATHELAT